MFGTCDLCESTAVTALTIGGSAVFLCLEHWTPAAVRLVRVIEANIANVEGERRQAPARPGWAMWPELPPHQEAALAAATAESVHPADEHIPGAMLVPHFAPDLSARAAAAVLLEAQDGEP